MKLTRYNNYDLPYLDEFVRYDSIGYLVASPDGTKICAANYSANSFDLFDFDTHTGELLFKIEFAG